MLDVGRWPHGTDSVTEAVAAAFVASGFESIARADIARWKYTKLLLNLGNPVDALCPRDADAAELVKLARREGLEVLAAAGIDHVSEAEDEARRGDVLRIVPIDQRRRPGGSTWQSLARGASVEVDYLNGEIVLLGRLHDVPTPVNELLQHATHRAAAEGTTTWQHGRRRSCSRHSADPISCRRFARDTRMGQFRSRAAIRKCLRSDSAHETLG